VGITDKKNGGVSICSKLTLISQKLGSTICLRNKVHVMLV